MGRASVDQCADKTVATQLYHVDSQTDRLCAVLFGALTLVPCCASGAVNVVTHCANEESSEYATSHEFAPVIEIIDDRPIEPSWIFGPSTFTHDPKTGARVAQYMRKPPVEPLDDQRAVTSSYRRTRTMNRGRDGSYDTTYQVQAWGNGRGGIDAEWERFHDAWKESILSGGYYNYNGPVGPYGYGGGYPAYGYGGYPGYGYGGYPGHGYGGYPGNGYGAPGYGFPPGPGGPPPRGGWHQGHGPYGDE